VVIATKAAGPTPASPGYAAARATSTPPISARRSRPAAAPANRAYRFIPIALAEPQRAHLRQQRVQSQAGTPCIAIEETLAALGDLVKEGKIGAIGVSNESCWGVSEFIKQSEMKGLPRIATIQNLYNLTARHYETSLLDETCYRENVSLLAYSPLAFGQLTAKYLDDPKAHGRLTIFPPTGARATCARPWWKPPSATPGWRATTA
jgi:hypothetical protein